jgi:phosphoglycerate dehydrogenase-like enzyme
VNAHDVADHAIALFLALWHGIVPNDALVRGGGWREGVIARRSLRGRRAGVVGLGRIGHAIATRLAAHKMHVAWWGPRDKADAGFPRAESLHALAERSDALFVASRAVPDNAGQIDAAILQALGPDGVLVNVSRGFLIDEAALVTALADRRIGGAALDVFEHEPTDPARWRDLPNVVLSPHLAGYTHEAGEDLFGQLRANIERHFRGEPLLTPVG